MNIKVSFISSPSQPADLHIQFNGESRKWLNSKISVQSKIYGGYLEPVLSDQYNEIQRQYDMGTSEQHIRLLTLGPTPVATIGTGVLDAKRKTLSDLWDALKQNSEAHYRDLWDTHAGLTDDEVRFIHRVVSNSSVKKKTWGGLVRWANSVRQNNPLTPYGVMNREWHDPCPPPSP